MNSFSFTDMKVFALRSLLLITSSNVADAKCKQGCDAAHNTPWKEKCQPDYQNNKYDTYPDCDQFRTPAPTPMTPDPTAYDMVASVRGEVC